MNKLLRSAALISCLVAGSAHAVGLGEARLLSRYGQPLLIEVPLYHDGALDDLVVNIANGATYTSMGLDKNGELHLAQVQKIVRENQRFLVVQTKEPYGDLWVSLVLEIQYRTGLLRRHFDFLIELPDPAEQAPLVVPNPGIERPGDRGMSASERNLSGLDPAPDSSDIHQARAELRPAALSSMRQPTLDPGAAVNPGGAPESGGGMGLKKTALSSMQPTLPDMVRPAAGQGLRSNTPAKVAYPRISQDMLSVRLSRLLGSIEDAEQRLELAVADYGQVVSMIAELDQLRSQRHLDLAGIEQKIEQSKGTLAALLPGRRWMAWGVLAAVAFFGLILGFITGRNFQR